MLLLLLLLLLSFGGSFGIAEKLFPLSTIIPRKNKKKKEKKNTHTLCDMLWPEHGMSTKFFSETHSKTCELVVRDTQQNAATTSKLNIKEFQNDFFLFSFNFCSFFLVFFFFFDLNFLFNFNSNYVLNTKDEWCSLPNSTLVKVSGN